METVTSADGTTIAFDQLGAGTPLVLVAGASCDRAVDAAIAAALAADFTVLNYDRRGRGDSTDTLPYAVERELEDLEVLIAAAGGTATLVGLSSGGALAARAAADGLPVSRLVMWETPFRLDPEGQLAAKEYTARLTDLLAEDRRGDALALFMGMVGLPAEMIDGMRQSPYWAIGERMAPTLAYDAAVMGEGALPEHLAQIGCPTLVLAGGGSPEWFRESARAAAAAIPGAAYEMLPGQTHDVAADVLATAVRAFSDTRVAGVITGFALVCINVHDLDVAKEFYVETLGFELGMDQVLDGHRWLTVHAPGRPETPLMLTVPEAPMVEEPIATELRSLLARGYLSVGALSTDDCHATYQELKGKGVEFIEEPEDRFYGVDAAFRDPSGNHWRLTQPRTLDEIRDATG